jgi:sugar/nucleoside kinase (ribokinase family)
LNWSECCSGRALWGKEVIELSVLNSQPDVETYQDFVLDVVGIGALNLDYIANAAVLASEARFGSLTSDVRELLAQSGVELELGTEVFVDGHTINAVLEVASTVSPYTELGGSAFNAIYAIARTQTELRLGYVGVAGKVPVLGVSAIRKMAEMGIDHRYVLPDADRLSGICFSFADEGERTLLTHAGANAGMGDYLDAEFDSIVTYLTGARVVHVTSFPDPATAGRLLAVLQAVRRANPATRISFDPGHVWCTEQAPEVDAIVRLSDYLLVNYREFRDLGRHVPGETDEEVAARLIKQFDGDQSVVIVKRPSGVLLFRQDGGKLLNDFYPQVALSAGEIEDATGAGDVFAAGLLIVLTCERLQVELGSLLGMRLARHKLHYVGSQGTHFAEVTGDFIKSLDTQRRAGSLPRGIFIAHGASPEWMAVKLFIEERLSVPVFSFETDAWGGRQVTEALTYYLDRCSLAICVLTAEDHAMAAGPLTPRQNVVHELGLFQGRYGFDRAVALVEDGCDVAHAEARHTMIFPHNAVNQTFHQLEEIIRGHGLGPVADY